VGQQSTHRVGHRNDGALQRGVPVLPTDRIEVHVDAIEKGEKVLIVDDLIATGGTAEAAVRLVQKMKGDIVECCFIIDLPDIGGRDRLENMGQKVFTLCEFEGE